MFADPQPHFQGVDTPTVRWPTMLAKAVLVVERAVESRRIDTKTV